MPLKWQPKKAEFLLKRNSAFYDWRFFASLTKK